MKSLRLGVILNEDGGYNTMKMIKANRDRDLIAQTIFKCGEFAYELDKDFLTLPDFLRYTDRKSTRLNSSHPSSSRMPSSA